MHAPTRLLLLLNVAALAVCSDVGNAQSTAVAVPVTTVTDTARHATPQRGYTGYSADNTVTATLQGTPRMLQSSPLIVTAIAPGSPAAKAGLELGDVILAVDGIDVETVDAGAAIWPFFVGLKYVMRIRRGDEDREIVIVPIARTGKNLAPRP